MGNKHEVSSTKVGKLSGTMCTKDGQAIGKVRFENVTLVKTGYNLFSLTLLQLKGWKLFGDNKSIWLEKDGHKLIFDIPIKTPNGIIFATYISRDTGLAAIEAQPKVTKSYKQAHQVFGHVGKAMTLKMAKHQGWIITGITDDICESCQVAKAKQKSLPKHSEEENEVNIKRVHLDISTIKGRKLPDGKYGPSPTKPVWLLIVDARTQRKISAFFNTKDEIVQYTCELFSRWKRNENKVTHIRMDNAGENQKLANEVNNNKWKLDVLIEYTARDTPQQNSLVEVGFNTLACRAKALMYEANVPDEL